MFSKGCVLMFDVNNKLIKLEEKFGQNLLYVPMLIDANPARGLKYVAYNLEKIFLINENDQVLWMKRIEGICDIRIRHINYFSHENLLELYCIDESIKLLTHTGEVIEMDEDKLIDERYKDYIEGEVQGYNHYDCQHSIDTKAAFDIPKGYYEINIQIEKENEGEEIKIFDEDGLCIYIGKDSKIKYKIVNYKEKQVRICSRNLFTVIDTSFKEIEEEVVQHFIGDSTLANQTKLPLYGWAQLYQTKTNIITNNIAYSGRSVKSFCFEGRFNKLLNVLKAGDIVTIGFGHNDARTHYFGSTPTEYIDFLKYYKKEIEKIGASVVICTPIAQRWYDAEYNLLNTHFNYEQAILDNFEVHSIVNLNKLLMNKIESMGFEKSKELFNIHPFLEMNDNTHLSYKGACSVVEMYIEEEGK